MAKRQGNKTRAENASTSPAESARQQKAEGKGQPPAVWIQCGLGGYLAVLFGVLVLGVLALWFTLTSVPVVEQPQLTGRPAPVTAPATQPTERASPQLSWAQFVHKQRIVVGLVLVLGALGGVLFGMFAFCFHLAMGDFDTRYVWWYILRPPLGAGMALLVFFVFRGGFITPRQDISTFDIYSTAGLAGLAGMFSEQATRKLGEVFGIFFRTKSGFQREEKEEWTRLEDLRASDKDTGSDSTKQTPTSEATSPSGSGSGSDG